jgi:maleate isomerase
MQRLGVILPSSNTTVEYEFSRALQGADVSVHYARVPLQDVTVQGLEGMECELDNAAQLLADAGVEVVAFACTSGSLVKGLGYDSKLAKRISEVAHCPTLTTSGAVLDALRALNARKVCLGTPYLSEVAAKEVCFLEGNGFEVLKEQSLGIKENLKIGRLTPTDAEKLAKTVFTKDTDAVFISCTNFRTFETLSKLESELGVPVISSNSATLWAGLNQLRVRSIISLGQLFNFHRTVNSKTF